MTEYPEEPEYALEDVTEEENEECAPIPTASVGSYGGFASGGITSGGGFVGSGYPPLPSTWPAPGYPYPSTTTPAIPTISAPTTGTKSVKKKMVKLPSRFTEKVLIAFLDEENKDKDYNDEIVWAMHLKAKHFEMKSDGEGGMSLVLEFSLEDEYDDNK